MSCASTSHVHVLTSSMQILHSFPRKLIQLVTRLISCPHFKLIELFSLCRVRYRLIIICSSVNTQLWVQTFLRSNKSTWLVHCYLSALNKVNNWLVTTTRLNSLTTVSFLNHFRLYVLSCFFFVVVVFFFVVTVVAVFLFDKNSYLSIFQAIWQISLSETLPPYILAYYKRFNN